MSARKFLFSYETKIGILAVISVAILIWGFTYLKGRNVLSTSKLVYVEYPNIEMLSNSSPVLISGFQVGVVADIYLKPEDMRTIVVVLDINRNIRVPKNAVAEIISTDLMGGKGIRLAFTSPCTGDDCVQSGDYLEGRVRGMLGSMIPQEDLNKYLKQLTGAVGEIFDTLGNKIEDPDSKGLAESVRNFNALTANLNLLILTSTKSIESTFSHLASITGTIEEENEQIAQLLKNLSTFSDQLNKIQLDETMNNLNGTMTNADSAMVELKKTLGTAKIALDNMASLMDGIQQGEGTLGQLVTNDSLYFNLLNTSTQLESLLSDFEKRPYRYMPLKSRNKVLRQDRKDAKIQDN